METLQTRHRMLCNGPYTGKFPEGFMWGAASSAYQIEGATDVDGKGENVWDHLCKTELHRIEGGRSGNVACDSYNRYEEDIKLLKNMGGKMYRISISWVRVLPKGTIEEVNQKGIDFYNRVINCCLENGIQPLVTIYHFDLPLVFAETKPMGWLNESIFEHYINFARICFENFGDRVKYWNTINEPWVHSLLAYDLGWHPPAKPGTGSTNFYAAIHNQLKAHALAYRLYEKEFKDKQNGKVGLALDSWWFEPANPDSPDDQAAHERAMAFKSGITMHPLVYGCYPPILKDLVDQKSKEEGLAESRLPVIDDKWSAIIKGSYDFLGINNYTCEFVTTVNGKIPEGCFSVPWYNSSTQSGNWETDQDTLRYYDKALPIGSISMLCSAPKSFRHLLNYIRQKYNNPEIIITENGIPTLGKGELSDLLEDTIRVNFYRDYICELQKAIVEDGCNVTGYLPWSLLDSWEWSFGTKHVFGFHHVDFESGTRTPKASAKLLTSIYKANGFENDN